MHSFYVDVLSFKEARRADIPTALSRAIRTARDGYTNVWLQAPGGEIVKLMKPPAAPVRHPAATYSSDRTGFAYLTFYCKDLEGVLAKARAAGALVRSDDSSRSGSIGVKLAFFEDPEGNVLELVEPV
jgi:catechol 2,3-dioxygenase-like lactoylglutathione lyase family enzyme